MTQLPTGTVTFLFTDIQGSTPLEERQQGRRRTSLGALLGGGFAP